MMTIVISFFVGVLASIIGTIIAKWISEAIPILFDYPDIRGEWIGQYEYEDKILEEPINISKQFLSRFKGTFCAHNPKDKEDKREYNLSGRFITHNIIIGQFTSKSVKHKTDVGVFMIRFDFARKVGHGGSVSYDVEQLDGPPVPRKYTMRQKEKKEQK